MDVEVESSSRINRIIAVETYARGAPAVTIGVQTSDRLVAWADCPDLSEEITVVRDLLQSVVDPLLQDRPFAPLHALMRELDAVRVTRKRRVAQPPAAGVTRRMLLTAQDDSLTPSYTMETVQAPLPAGLRYGLGQALLRLATRAAPDPMSAVARLLGCEPSPNLPQLHGEIQGAMRREVPGLLRAGAVSLGYTTAGVDAAGQLGADGALLQRFVRDLATTIDQHTAAPLTIDLDVRGAYGELCGDNAGRQLGMLVGLRAAAKPHRVRVIDPMLPAEPEAYRHLRDYIRIRKLPVSVGVTVASAEAARGWKPATADFICMAPAQVGSVVEALDIAAAAATNGVPVHVAIAAAETVASAELTTAIAVALGAQLVRPRAADGFAAAASLLARAGAWRGLGLS